MTLRFPRIRSNWPCSNRGFHHHIDSGPLGRGFHQQCFAALVDGITESIVSAEADLKEGKTFLAQGEVEGAGVNRSRVAYMNNPAEERAKYKSDVDTTMTLLKFVRADGAIGMLNWFAVHGTSMNFNNKLISGDNKGYAAYAVEQAHGTRYQPKSEFVAAFAQSNAGDVTPNLNLNNTGPGKNDVESTQIIGRRQARAAEKLFERANVPLSGPVDCRLAFVDFSKLEISGEFSGAGPQRTCPSALGYAFAAGSTEDGGGNPLFHEGMKETSPLIESMVRAQFPTLIPTEELRRCHKPKAILLATGVPRPPAQEQILPIGLVRIGQLVLAVGPAEFTTMAGRRIRAALGKELGIDPHLVVIAGYANDYGNYVTTRAEYDAQQYEGGSTIFGPWTEAGYRQEFVRLAHAMKTGQPVTPTLLPADMRSRVKTNVSLEGPDELLPENAKPGDLVLPAKEKYRISEIVELSFWSGSPVNDYKRTDRFLAIERRVASTGAWKVVREDFDWDTTIRWKQLHQAAGARLKSPEPYLATVRWQTDSETEPGTYRIRYFGKFKRNGKVDRFTATSKEFEIRP